MIWFLMLIRWTLPRFRYDQAMRLGWLGLFPLAVLNIVLTAAVLLLWGDEPVATAPATPPPPTVLQVRRQVPANARQRFYLAEVLVGLRADRAATSSATWAAHRARVGQKGARGAVTIQYPEERRPLLAAAAQPAPPGAARRRLAPLRGLHDVRDGVPGALHLHRGQRAPESRHREGARALRHRPRQVRVLRLLRRGLPRGRDPHGHGHPRVLVLQPRAGWSTRRRCCWPSSRPAPTACRRSPVPIPADRRLDDGVARVRLVAVAASARRSA